MWFVLVPGIICCYDSICEKTYCTATQSSKRNNLSANKVIDGIIEQNENSCSHTAEDEREAAWVMVDLRKEYELKNVKIFYRNEAKWKPYRFRQYSLEVSRSSTPEYWNQCYKDDTPNNRTPVSIQNISCEKTARYLRIRTTYDAPEDDEFSIKSPILEICEIKVYGCDIGFYGPNCLSCGDCKKCDIVTGCETCSTHCSDGQCNREGYCLSECNAGYWGGKCEKTCISNCLELSCEKRSGYLECPAGCVFGYYGTWCSYVCSGNCSSGTCKRNTGECEACFTGFRGAMCDKKCSNNCLNHECGQLDGQCTNGCNSGSYGPFCTMQCSENCANTNCSRNGVCIGGCKPNWTGDNCYTQCSSNCVGIKCDRNGDCALGCIQGHYGKKCLNSCPPNCLGGTCSNTGLCNSCIDGYFGDRCKDKCHWRNNCSGQKCNNTNGFCVNGCNPGLSGNYCERPCGNCSSGTCERKTGNCEACKTGFHGAKCDKKCSNFCLNEKCRQKDGHCIKGCRNDTYGPLCNMGCSKYCAHASCHQSGTCIGGCQQNWTGNKCDRCDSSHYGQYCSLSCSMNCKEQACNNITGSCNFGCKGRFYSDKCEKSCSSCPTVCNRYTGECEGKCAVGKYGKHCDHTCNPNCKNGCRKSDGVCDSGCIVGKFRANCQQNCGEGCISGCSQADGSCACKSGWQGINCDACDSSHYGSGCLNECSVNCNNITCNNSNGFCTFGCNNGFYSQKCEKSCSSSCPSACNRQSGECRGECLVGKFGHFCNKTCNRNCKNGCNKTNGSCEFGCTGGKFGTNCMRNCGGGCISDCLQTNGSCSCKPRWQGQGCHECHPYYYGEECYQRCSTNCLNGTCHSNNGSCIGGCKGDFIDEKCTLEFDANESPLLPTTAIGGGIGTGLFVLFIMIIIGIFITRHRRGKHTNSKPTAVIFQKNKASSSTEKKMYTSKGNVLVTIEDPEEEPQIENPEEAVYYNDLSVAKDIAVLDLLKIITQKEAKENEGFLKEFKMLPYGERFDCEIAKAKENMPKNRFKTTFSYDHSRVILDTSRDFTSDYINANYIENMEGKREFIACQGPLKNTLVDHWRMIWQEHVEYIVMLTNLVEGPKVKCHQYWPDQGKELDINPFTVTLVEEKQYAFFVERRMTLHNKKVSGSRTVVQYHYTRWPDHGTPNPLNLIVFHRHLRHKIRSTQNPIIVHCSAGIGRTGTFIAFDVLSRFGKEKGKVNVIEYVKAMRKDRMTMIQNVDQYVFLYHALYEFFRRKVHYIKRDEFLSQYGDMNKKLTNEFNELISLKPKFDANEFKSGKKFSELNFTKSVLPVEQHLVYLTSHVQGRQCYYNAVNVCSFTRADEFLSAQFPVSGAAIDLLRLLTDQESAFLISLNPLSELKELQSWVDGKDNPLKLSPYTVTKGSQEVLSGKIRKTNLKISTKEETHHVEIFECLNWSSKDTLPMETSVLTTLIKQFSLDRKANINGPVTVISKDGATCCGVFITVYNAIEQLQQDDEVDIFTIVQQLQCRRPEMVSTKDEYEFCFKAVSDFLNTESVYANT